ncbi:hypothetical protein [Niveispirillum sp. KHB5.9]|uniref:hypothetical protein n=1 Tax=Niveispirillum sp. KHB5.9 TaxID=3400269 RepID=UPI003A8434DE
MIDGFDPAWPAIDDWVARVRDSPSIIASNVTAILNLDAVVLAGGYRGTMQDTVISSIKRSAGRHR